MTKPWFLEYYETYWIFVSFILKAMNGTVVKELLFQRDNRLVRDYHKTLYEDHPGAGYLNPQVKQVGYHAEVR